MLISSRWHAVSELDMQHFSRSVRTGPPSLLWEIATSWQGPCFVPWTSTWTSQHRACRKPCLDEDLWVCGTCGPTMPMKCPIIHFIAFFAETFDVHTYVCKYILYIYIIYIHAQHSRNHLYTVHGSTMWRPWTDATMFYFFTYARNISMILCDQRGNVLKICKSSTYRYVEVCLQGPLGLGCKTCDGMTIQAWQCIDFTFIYCILPVLNCL